MPYMSPVQELIQGLILLLLHNIYIMGHEQVTNILQISGSFISVFDLFGVDLNWIVDPFL